MKVKKDWWLANSLVNIISGIYFIISRASVGMLSAGLFIGGINILIGVALLQKSKIAFWVVLIMNGFGLLSTLNNLSKQPGNYLPMIVNVIAFAFAIMLWQQIRKEEKKK